MAKAKKLRFGNCLLCEHVVPGAYNKQTLVNVYTGDIRIAELPAAIFFGLYIEYSPDDIGEMSINLEIKIGDTAVGRIESKFVVGPQLDIATISIPIFAVTLDKDTKIEVTANSPGYKAATVLSRKITKDPSLLGVLTTASEPPALSQPGSH
jgi:hypothetical protein